jgi:rhodanese-related sulfurtransferase
MKQVWLFVVVTTLLFAGIGTSGAMTPQDLKVLLAQQGDITVIDIRSNALYRQGHIQGAINIPAAIIDKKRLPPIGRVIVCGEAVRRDLSVAAVGNLNSRKGIDAELLEGGYGSWEALNLPTTQRKGLGRKRIRYLTYQGLERAAAADRSIVLVDIRRGSGPGRELTAKIPTREAAKEAAQRKQALTELSRKFPGVEIIKVSAKGFDQVTRAKDRQHRSLYVMIDDGDGRGEKLARRLFAAGVKQVAILTGGEQSLRRQGRPGRMRTQQNAKGL